MLFSDTRFTPALLLVPFLSLTEIREAAEVDDEKTLLEYKKDLAAVQRYNRYSQEST